MNTSHNKYDAIENLIFNEGLKIETIDFNAIENIMNVHVNNQMTFVIPIRLFKKLQNAPFEKLKDFKLIAMGTGIHWPELDEDLSLKGFLQQYLRQKVNSEKELVLA